MKTFQSLRGLLYFILGLAFFGCTDHSIPTVSPGSVPERLRVKSLTQEGPNTTAKVSLFGYDAQGRLSTIQTFQTPDSTVAAVEHSVFEYDAQNRITQLRREIVRRSGKDPNPYEIYAYTYKGTGQVSELNYTNNVGDNNWLVKFSYNADNRLSNSLKTYITGGLRYSVASAYTFTGNNMTSAFISVSLVRTLPMSSSGTTTYTYDTKINPFYGVLVIPAPFVNTLSIPQLGILYYYTYYGGFDNILTLSQNNMLSGGNSTYAYTYNSADLPVSRVTTTSGVVTETLHYAYESY